MKKLQGFLIGGLVLMGLFWIGLLGGGRAAAAVIGTPTPTRTPTPTPTKAPNLVSRLTRTLFFSPGGGLSRDTAFNCRRDGVPEDSQPTIWFHGRAEYDIQDGELCMINFPVDVPFTIELTSPSGARYQQEMNTFEDNGYQGFDYEDDGGGFTYGMIHLWLSPDVEPGEWQVEYFSENDYYTFNIPIDWPEKSPALYIPRDDPNPFERPEDFFTLGAAHLFQIIALKPGQSLDLTGYNLPARQEVPIGLYQVTKVKDKDEELRLIQAISAKSNGSGEVSFSFKLNKGLPPGGYYLGAVTNLKAKDVYHSGGGLGVYVDSCPGAPASRLMVGDRVRLDTDNSGGDQDNKLYSEPGQGNNKTGQLGAALTGDILAGPTCVDSQVWWKLRTSKGAEGWIAEGSDVSNFLIRVK